MSKPPALQQPIERGLELRHVVAVVLEAVAGGERAQLQHPLGSPPRPFGLRMSTTSRQYSLMARRHSSRSNSSSTSETAVMSS